MERPTRHRSKAACQFCRARKLKCDNLEPECSACRARGIPCEYVLRTPAPRPSNAAIQALQAENQRLRNLLESSSNRLLEEDRPGSGDGVQNVHERSNSISSLEGPTQQGQFPSSENVYSDSYQVNIQQTGSSGDRFGFETQDPSVSSPPLNPERRIAANTSNGYIDQVSLDGQGITVDAVASSLDPTTRDVLRSQLVAAAARQRQVEALPSFSQAYDYDGYDPATVLHLFNIHWNRQHHNLLLIYRPLFMRDFAARGPYFSKLLLNAILFAASKFSPRTDIRKDPNRPSTAGWQYRQRFKELLGEAMDESRITTIQALITVASSLFAVESSSKSTAWLYSGIAFRMIIDLGLNVDGVELLKRQKVTAEELECRRRVFWGAFVFDKIHSMYFGRPVTLQETNVRVPIEFLDDYEELEQWIPLEAMNQIFGDYPMPTHPGGPSFSITTFSSLCRLSLVLGRIMNEVYSENTYNHGSSLTQPQNMTRVQVLLALDRDLDRWAIELPHEIKYEPWATREPMSLERTPTPTILSLHCLYHISTILLHRPYCTRGHTYDENQAPSSLITCVRAAMRLACTASAYCHAFTIRRAPYFIAYSAYVAITILMRVSAQLERGSDVQKYLHNCLHILAESERINAGVKRASFVVSKLLFAVARSGPNPFPSSEITSPWGTICNDNITLDHATSARILKTFSTSSPDAAAEQSQLEIHASEPGLSGPEPIQNGESSLSTHMELDIAAQLLASLRSNTPAISTAAPTPGALTGQDATTPFPDTIFGLHSDESFQSWPDFGGQLETMLYGTTPPGLLS